jgi:hypothetical protein
MSQRIEQDVARAKLAISAASTAMLALTGFLQAAERGVRDIDRRKLGCSTRAGFREAATVMRSFGVVRDKGEICGVVYPREEALHAYAEWKEGCEEE